MATYAGKPTCSCGAKWLPVFVEYLDVTYDIRVQFVQLIGSAAASAGTHGGGLCFDLVVTDPGKRTKAEAYALVVKAARQLGADATWHRPYNWDGRKGMEHIHGLGTGCPHLKAAAKSQQADVRAGLNGLANKGKDTGPRPLSGRTWKQGIAFAKSHQKESIMQKSKHTHIAKPHLDLVVGSAWTDVTGIVGKTKRKRFYSRKSTGVSRLTVRAYINGAWESDEPGTLEFRVVREPFGTKGTDPTGYDYRVLLPNDPDIRASFIYIGDVEPGREYKVQLRVQGAQGKAKGAYRTTGTHYIDFYQDPVAY